jgi:hypothetical protein
MVKGGLLLAAVFVLAAITFDLAIYLSRIGKAQWEAEGMAIAAAQQLSVSGDEADALLAADRWMETNSRSGSHPECCTFADWRPLHNPDGTLDTVIATARIGHTTLFLHYLGLPEHVSLERSATAQVVGARGAPVCPWGIIADSSASGGENYYGLVPGRVYSFDLAGTSHGEGALLPLDLTGSGLSGYETAIAAGCRKEETGVWSVGDSVRFLSGGNDVAEATLQAVNDHYQFESADGQADYLGPVWCDVTFAYDGGAGAGYITGFDPYAQQPRSECVRGTLDGGAGRLVVVPIVSPPQGGETVRILGLASMYIATWDRGPTAAGRIYGVFFDRTDVGVDSVDLIGDDDSPLAPLRIASTH